MNKNYFSNKKVILTIIISIISILTIYKYRYNIYPCFCAFNNEKTLELYLQSIGIWKIPIFILFQIIQVIIFFLPGQVIQIVGGYVFGIFIGTILNIIGISIGSISLFYMCRKMGINIINKFVKRSNFNKFKKLLSNKKINLIVFLLYLLPGMPKDNLIFICALTNISFKDFVVYSLLGRIPGIIISSIIGANVANGNELIVIIITVIVLVILIIVIIKKDKLLHRISKI